MTVNNFIRIAGIFIFVIATTTSCVQQKNKQETTEGFPVRRAASSAMKGFINYGRLHFTGKPCNR